MAKTLLDGVNDVLLLGGELETGTTLDTLTDTRRQPKIDKCVQSWKVLVDELYETPEGAQPTEEKEDTITLGTGTRAYALASDLSELRWPLLDETNGNCINAHPGGYLGIVNEQTVPSDYTGLAVYAAIRPTDGYLYLDMIPTATEDGLVYKYRYDKVFSITAAGDTFPFSDAVYRAMVFAVHQYWQRLQKKDWDEGMYKGNLGRARRLLSRQKPLNTWLPQRVPTSISVEPTFLNPLP